MAVARSRRLPQNYWPGFVDALAALLMVAVFLIMVFALAQFSYSELLSRSEGQVGNLETRLAESERNLAAARELGAQEGARAQGLALQLTQAEDRTARAVAELAAREARVLELIAGLDALQAETNETNAALAGAARQAENAAEVRAGLDDQLARLNDELGTLAASLEATEAQAGTQAREIEDLSDQLARALASRVEELEKYRSEFFGRLREVLGDQPGIRIVGDRFVLQSEILFPSGEALLGVNGRLELAHLAGSLAEISVDIPADIDWILRIGGHTDSQPIATDEFPSNWALSVARALQVVQFLAAEGIPENRLMAAGFGEFQPIDEGNSPAAMARNRRIEFKLTER